MRKNYLLITSLIITIAATLNISTVKAQEVEQEKKLPKYFQLHVEKPNIFKEKGKKGEFKAKAWKFVKGKPANNAVILGMYSYHTHDTNKEFNGTNNMGALQYKGIAAGTFKNSFNDQTYYLALARKVYEKNLTKDIKLDVQYKAGLMHGYGPHYPDLAGITPLVLPIVGFTYKGIGADFWPIPGRHPIFAVNFKVNVPEIKNRKQPKKIETVL